MHLQAPDKQKEVSELVGDVEDLQFNELMELSKMMSDYKVDAGADDGGEADMLDNDIGVAVEFEGDEDEEDGENVTEVVVSVLRSMTPYSIHISSKVVQFSLRIAT